MCTCQFCRLHFIIGDSNDPKLGKVDYGKGKIQINGMTKKTRYSDILIRNNLKRWSVEQNKTHSWIHKKGYLKKWDLDLNSQERFKNQISAIFCDCFELYFNLVKINAEARHKDLFNEVVNYFEVEYVPGGCTLNTLRICQWMSLSESVAVFSGAIGNDNFGEILARTIERQKVKAHLVKGLFILGTFEFGLGYITHIMCVSY